MNGENVVLARTGQPYPSPEAAYAALAGQYGTVDWRSWQYLRRKWFYKAAYVEAGASVLNFFGNTAGTGGLTQDDTNIPESNKFGNQHVLLKSLQFAPWIKTWDLTTFDGTDASTLVSDMINGFPHAGVARLVISSREYCQIPCPLLYCPPADGQGRVYTAGLSTLTLTEGTPNTLLTSISNAPYSELSGYGNIYLLDPQILIEIGQTFQLTIEFPSGLVPVIGTAVTDDTTNPLKIKAIMDTVTIRPKQ